MVKQQTIDKYTKFIGKNFGCIHVDDIDLSEANKSCGCCNKMKMDLHLSFFLQQIEKIYSNIETIKSSSTIPKGSTSKAIVDGNGVHLKFERDGDIVKSA